MGKLFLLSAVLFECLACVALVRFALAQDEAWKEIETQLNQRGQTNNNPAENYKLAMELLSEESARWALLNILPSRSIKERVIDKLKKLQELQYRIDNSICNQISYDLRAALLEGTSHYLKYPRTQGVILQQAYELANVCQKQHALAFKRRIEHEMLRSSIGSKDFFRYVRPFLAKIIYATITQDDEDSPSNSTQGENQLDALNYNGILNLVLEDPDRLREIHSQFIFDFPWSHRIGTKEAKVALTSLMSIIERLKVEDRRLVERVASNFETGIRINMPAVFFYEIIVGNCRQFVVGFGSEVFWNAQLDVKYLGAAIIEERSKLIADFYLTWASYRVCMSLVHNKDLEFQMRSKISEQADLLGQQTGQHPNDTPLLTAERANQTELN